MNKRMSPDVQVKLYITARNNEKLSIFDVARDTGIDIEYIKQMKIRGEIREVNGKLSISEQNLELDEEKVKEYLKQNPGTLIFKLPIELGISIDKIKKMIDRQILVEENGKVYNNVENVMDKMKKVRIGFLKQPKPFKYQLAMYSGLTIDEIDELICAGYLKENSEGIIEENKHRGNGKDKSNKEIESKNEKTKKFKEGLRVPDKDIQEIDREMSKADFNEYQKRNYNSFGNWR